MDLADSAFSYRRKGDDEQAKRFFLEALELERQAAELLPATEDSEPSRSILYRSAASLAYNGDAFDEAERLIAYGLIGFPPPEIKEELKDLYENINFKRHLHQQGIVLSKNSLTMTLYGNATSYGGTSVEPLILRVEKITALFYRTVERLLGLQYRISGNTKKEIKDTYGLYVNAFAPASFAVAFQIGAPEIQPLLFADYEQERNRVEPDEVIEEVMKCLEIIESAKPDRLKERIPDLTYYQNFVGIAKEIAPDGDEIKLVGFNTLRSGEDWPVALRKRRDQIKDTFAVVEATPAAQVSHTILTGILTFANSPPGKTHGSVKLIDADTMLHRIRVPIALMKDIVQPYYEERVIVTCHSKNNTLFLDDIVRAT
ncbi:MAG TPA: hypothetical protein VGO56_03690 [Pyrinomonadaceae bacterium]|nr:hypothetical protein [Pyrinomonadaceae bacterium]